MESATGIGIVLNRMYVGDYLTTNLGHEVINLFQTDNGHHYLYLNSTGDFVKAHQGRIGYMLFVKYSDVGEVEVIGMAKGLHDVYDANQKFDKKYGMVNEEIFERQQAFAAGEGGITYGGVSIFDIFDKAEQQSVFITYKADKVFVPRKGERIFIRFRSDNKKEFSTHNSSDIIIELHGYQQAKASLKQYIYPEGTYSGDLSKQNIEEKKGDYDTLLERLINNKDLWEESHEQISEEKFSDLNHREISLFDICQIQNDENKFSNALAYFMLQAEYRKLWQEFFSRFDIDLGESYTIAREEASKIEDSKVNHKKYPSGGRIDLLIRTDNSLIVIENKIKSDINSVENDGEGKQLRRYYNYAHWLAADKENPKNSKECHFIILTPRYNIPTIDDDEMRKTYKIITYKDVYDFLSSRKSVFAHDANFVAFYEAMHRHTHENVNDYLYYEMQEKFFRRIKEKSTKK